MVVTNSQIWTCRDRVLDLAQKTHIMGILNVTPDSFSDGGEYLHHDRAVEHAQEMIDQGADIIDIGGESTRPGASEVNAEEELNRIIPVIRALAESTDTLISVDTTKAAVAREALAAGAHIVNDISGFQFDTNMAPIVAEYGAGCVLMHIKGKPRTMQNNPTYDNLFDEITSYLQTSMELAESAGIRPEQIVVDPGIGFGKRLQDNLEIIRDLSRLKILKRPILIGPSRKSFIGAILGTGPEARLEGTAAAVAVSIMNGARIVRVHDVAEIARLVKVIDAILENGIHQ